MAYNQNIPQPNDLLSQSQGEIQQNFSEIQTLVGINHINFGAAGAGKHLYLQLPEHAAPTTAVNEAGFYANVGATSAVTELFFRRENNGDEIPMTEHLAVATGWSYLPSGIILQWGQGGSGAFVFPKVFPNNCFSVNLTAISNGVSKVAVALTGAPTTAGFSTYSWAIGGSQADQPGTPLRYIAIGN